MENLANVFELDFIIRILAAVLLGFAIGLEREMTNKCAGLRTNILVCLGACIFTLISIYGFPMEMGISGVRDTGRVAAQIVTGIGFIGGGTVLRHGATVLGLTTAATLWISASIGMACGAGMYGVATVGAIFSIITLVSVKFLENSFWPSRTNRFIKKVKANLKVEHEHVGELHDFIMTNYPDLIEISQKPIKDNDDLVKIELIVYANDRKPIDKMYNKFNDVEGIVSISIQECVQ